MSIIDTLITDRSALDVAEYQELRSKIINRTATVEEVNKWIAGMKACYNASDLNRVGSTVGYVVDRLNTLQQVIQDYLDALEVSPTDIFRVPFDYPIEGIITKTDWTRSDIPTKSEMTTYLNNITILHNMWTDENDFPEVPTNPEKLTITDANAIETLLYMIDGMIDSIEAEKKALADKAVKSFRYCGTFYTGQGVILP